MGRTEPGKRSDEEHRRILRNRLRAAARRKPKLHVMHAAINDLRSLSRRGEDPEVWYRLVLEACEERHRLYEGTF